MIWFWGTIHSNMERGLPCSVWSSNKRGKRDSAAVAKTSTTFGMDAAATNCGVSMKLYRFLGHAMHEDRERSTAQYKKPRSDLGGGAVCECDMGLEASGKRDSSACHECMAFGWHLQEAAAWKCVLQRHIFPG